MTRETVTSQLVYEMGDPSCYITPDCIADFTSIELSDSGNDRVDISGIKGRLQQTLTRFPSRFTRATRSLVSLPGSPDAVDKAKLCADIVFDRVALDGVHFEQDERFVEIVGTNVCHAGITAAPEVRPRSS